MSGTPSRSKAKANTGAKALSGLLAPAPAVTAPVIETPPPAAPKTAPGAPSAVFQEADNPLGPAAETAPSTAPADAPATEPATEPAAPAADAAPAPAVAPPKPRGDRAAVRQPRLRSQGDVLVIPASYSSSGATAVEKVSVDLPSSVIRGVNILAEQEGSYKKDVIAAAVVAWLRAHNIQPEVG